MNSMQELIERWLEEPELRTIYQGIQDGLAVQMVAGLTGSTKALTVAASVQKSGRPAVLVSHNLFSAQKMAEDLKELFPDQDVMLYPANERVAEMMAKDELTGQRIETIQRLAEGFSGILVVPLSGLCKLIPPPEVMRNSKLQVRVGDQRELEHLAQTLVTLGYARAERVDRPGEWAMRGGIVDIYPLGDHPPVRIEFFDDIVDSIRLINPDSQKSEKRLEEATFLTAQECFADQQRKVAAADHLADRLQERLDKITDRELIDKLSAVIGRDIDNLREGHDIDDLYKYVSMLYPERTTLMDYVSKSSVFYLDEPARLMDTAQQLEKDESEWITGMLQGGQWLPSLSISIGLNQVMYHKKHPILYMSLFLRQVPYTQPKNIVSVVSRSMQDFHGQMNVLKSESERWNSNGLDVIILANGQDRVQHIKRVLEDYEISGINVVQGNLQAGFELPSIRLVVLTETEMFSQRNRKVRQPKSRWDHVERVKSYLELKPGDYVVHLQHGIGQYLGIGTLEIDGIHKDYLHVQYAAGDKLSVPVDQIDLIQKYVGAEDKTPKVYKLGGSDWQCAKSKAKKSVEDIADDLIKLYAERQAMHGHAFTADTPYQNDFEGLFPYEETRDQLTAIDEIKRDMEKPRPMDRLLCGDVGYGKTEVAIRAAFKAAIDGKQVAVLVPTTILAQQHYETFRERFFGFPIRIEVLSRFRSRKEITDSLKGLRQGTVDIVIGTHRVLSKDVVFKDLGLLIVDEEQRFGVTHKERLKKLRSSVDVLTLTATPIPRTLHMSMIGVRDLSTIETPPENRYPVQTYVSEFNFSLVREAIERELARGGQVYVLFNRVQGIHAMAEQIRAIVPDARVSVGHGQMNEQELERTILDFLEGESDVLVCTSIIETGVDIPNVNTLIVNNADQMGLSQLYQLRGRVGRSNRIAYAYFTYQKDKILNEVAEKRLESIKQFTELGSGFKIAMRDLSIRGAGNLLGAKQHGFIASVGFDLYQQMLAEEISKRKAELEGREAEDTSKRTISIQLDVDAYLPAEYIYDNIQKIEIYKKVVAISTLEEAMELEDELVDRFGDPTHAVLHLLAIARIKVYGSLYAVESIGPKLNDIAIRFHKSAGDLLDPIQMAKAVQASSLPVRWAGQDRNELRLRSKGLDGSQLLELIEAWFKQMHNVLNTGGEKQYDQQDKQAVRL